MAYDELEGEKAAPFIKFSILEKLLPEHWRKASKKYLQNEILRLEALLHYNVVGDLLMNTDSGEVFEMTQATIDLINLRIVEFQEILAAYAE